MWSLNWMIKLSVITQWGLHGSCLVATVKIKIYRYYPLLSVIIRYYLLLSVIIRYYPFNVITLLHKLNGNISSDDTKWLTNVVIIWYACKKILNCNGNHFATLPESNLTSSKTSLHNLT
jgi:hypothetical protein